MIIKRELTDAESRDYDLAIVGGGIYGITLAFEAARRGLEVLMVEKDDFGSGVSWNSLRILHGGLRYLQKMDLARYGESVGERRWFLKHFPDVCGPLACMMPLYGRGLRRASVMRIALAMNDVLSFNRNKEVPLENWLEGGKIIGVDRARELFPLIEGKGLEAAAVWYDGQIRNSPRLFMELCRWASSMGAVLLNHVEGVGLEAESGSVRALCAKDRVTGRPLRFRAKRIVNAAGPWCETLNERMGEGNHGLFEPALAFNVLFDRAPMAETAVAATANEEGARTYFLHNEGSYLLGGTYHASLKNSGDTADQGEQLRGFVSDYIRQVNRAVPGLDLKEGQVLRVYAGRLPARKAGEEEPSDRPRMVDHGSAGGMRGVWSVSGVKYTTARLVAERTIHSVFPESAGKSKEVSRNPASEPALLALSNEIEAIPESDVISCARRLQKEEAVTCFDDLMLRRTAWALDPDVGRRIARAIGPELGYSFEEIDTCCEAIGHRVFDRNSSVTAG